MTFSLVARSDDGLSWGVVVASKFLAVGGAVPAAAAGLGAIATQADAQVAWKAEALALLAQGATAETVLAGLLADDPDRDDRQVGLVDADGRVAAFTGDRCFDWAGHRTGDGYCAQGNILAGPQVLDAMSGVWEDGAALPFGRRLLTSLAAGDAAGGDRRGRQSAALLVVRQGAGYGGRDDVAIDLRVDDHPDPVAELGRLLDLHDFYLTASTPEERVPVTPALAEELARRVERLGHEHVAEWVGSQNYEMRVAPGLRPEWIDRRVLAVLRADSDETSTQHEEGAGA